MYIFDIFKRNKLNNGFSPINNNYFEHDSESRNICNFHKKGIYVFYLLIIVIIDIIIYSDKFYIKDIKEPIIKKKFNEECRNIKKFMYLSKNNILLDSSSDLNNYISTIPKLSVVIPIYNAEKYIKQALTSIQNQDMKDIEIIMVDDCSEDNSINLINELMKTEPRIRLFQNQENKGTLYTKCRGVSLSKGKYVILLDEDDIFGQRDAFSTLYELAEKDNLDILGFSSMFTESQDELGTFIHHYYIST